MCSVPCPNTSSRGSLSVKRIFRKSAFSCGGGTSRFSFYTKERSSFRRRSRREADAELRAELERNSTDGLRLELGQRSDSARSLRAELAERTAWALSLDAQTNRLREHLRALYGSPAYRLGRRLGLAPEPIDEES